MFLADGPLEGQRLRVHAARGGLLPAVIYPHAPLPPDYLDEPTGRHSYRLDSVREYRHYRGCACLSTAS